MADTEVLAPAGYKVSGILDMVAALQTTEDTIPASHHGSPVLASYQISRSNVLNLLEEGISPASQNLLLPPGLLEDVTNAIWRMAVDEPCGFRGCVLNIVLCNDNSDSNPKKRRSLLELQNNTLITHKITILLYPDTTSWFSKMARLFRPKQTVVACNFSSEITRMCCYD